MNKQRKIVVDENTVKRAKRQGWRQGRDSRCIICSKDFRECPHPYRQVEDVIKICLERTLYEVRL